MLQIAQSSSSRAVARLATAPLRTAGQRRLASGGGSNYNQPSGFLFGEKPLPKGQKREKEDWESIWYWGMGGGLAFMTIGYLYKPDTSIQSWAMPEAKKNLEASGKTWKYVPSKNSDYYGKET